MVVEHRGFRRARRPEQVEARRAAILDSAVAMLRERPVADISLRELSERVGLAKSNVLRYFDSREAIFLEVLDRIWGEWLDQLEVDFEALAEPGPDAESENRQRREIELGSALAAAMLRDPLFCELQANMAGVLERNISLEVARSFKQRSLANVRRSAELVRARLPYLGEDDAINFVGAAGMLLAGMWPHTRPTESVTTAMAELGFTDLPTVVADVFRQSVIDLLVGVSARG
jgi:AcrR family transcriptional regulator